MIRTVAELIEELQRHDPTDPVRVAGFAPRKKLARLERVDGRVELVPA